MSAWRDPATWSALRSADGCPICQRGRPTDVVVELGATWVTMGEVSPMRGYVCVVFRRHAVELHDLSAAEGAAFIRDVQKVSAVVAEMTNAVKLNYEIHGNTLPHLHMHIFPRYVGDRFEGRPIDPRIVTEPVYAPGEFEEMRRCLQALGGDAAQEPGL